MPPPRVLLVEDYADAREMYAEFLRVSGFDVDTASDGLEGLQKARALQPDLLVLDLHVPKLDGFSVLAELRKDSALGDVPVIIVTASAQPSFVERGIHAGATAVLTKPCIPDDLAKALWAAHGKRG